MKAFCYEDVKMHHSFVGLDISSLPRIMEFFNLLEFVKIRIFIIEKLFSQVTNFIIREFAAKK